MKIAIEEDEEPWQDLSEEVTDEIEKEIDEKIEEMAFCSCKSLREIRVSEQNPNYTSIDGVLYDKAVTALICCPGGKESVTIPETVTRIEPSAFDGCAELKEIILPEQVSFIGRYAFLHCGKIGRAHV